MSVRKPYPKRAARAASERVWERVRVLGSGDCWEWQGGLRNGYGAISEGRSGSVRHGYAHRAAWESVNGPIPDGLLIRHKCDNRKCCNPDHLETGTVADNMQDMVTRGRSNYGERHHAARLTEDDVRAIRASGDPASEIATRYGIHKVHAYAVIRGAAWSHV